MTDNQEFHHKSVHLTVFAMNALECNKPKYFPPYLGGSTTVVDVTISMDVEEEKE
jgi:hypothetical protein